MRQLYGSKCLDQVIDFVDPVDSQKGDRFKGARFMVDTDLGNNKKSLSLYLVIGKSYSADDNF